MQSSDLLFPSKLGGFRTTFYLLGENMASILVWNTLAIANAKGRLGS